MSKTITKLITLIGMLCLLICFSNQSFAKGEYGCYLEAAPLKGVMGQPSFRIEGVFSRASFGVDFERTTADGDHDYHLDTTSKFGVEGLWYPIVQQQKGVFIGAGLQYEKQTVGKQRERDYVTWVKANSDEMQDRWVVEETNLLATQTIGYRFFFSEFATASLRVKMDEIARGWSSVKDEELKSRDPDLTTDSRSGSRTQFLMHAGISLR